MRSVSEIGVYERARLCPKSPRTLTLSPEKGGAERTWESLRDQLLSFGTKSNKKTLKPAGLQGLRL